MHTFLWSSVAAMGGGVWRIIAPFYVLLSLKRRVRAAHGRVARPNPTNFTYIVYEYFSRCKSEGEGEMLRRERNCVCVVAYATGNS